MSTQFEFHAEWACHEGGTKYYQVIRIREVGKSRGVVVTHWGAMHPGAPSEPKSHGQNKITECLSGVDSAFGNARSMKMKRGYKEWKTSKASSNTQAALAAVIDRWFKAEDARQILAFVVAIRSTPDELVEIIDPPPTPKVEAFKPASADKEEWGSW